MEDYSHLFLKFKKEDVAQRESYWGDSRKFEGKKGYRMLQSPCFTYFTPSLKMQLIQLRGQRHLLENEFGATGFSQSKAYSNSFSNYMNDFSFFFLFQLHMWHMEVPGPGIESDMQWQPIPQLWQQQILKPLCWTRGQSCTFAEVT